MQMPKKQILGTLTSPTCAPPRYALIFHLGFEFLASFPADFAIENNISLN